MAYSTVVLTLALLFTLGYAEDQCSGRKVGELKSEKPGIPITGEIYANDDSNCFELCKFTYEYEAPDMYFWCDKSVAFSKDTGYKLESAESKFEKIGKYTNKKTTVCLPKDKKIQDCKVFGLYCYLYSQIFATAPIKL